MYGSWLYRFMYGTEFLILAMGMAHGVFVPDYELGLQLQVLLVGSRGAKRRGRCRIGGY